MTILIELIANLKKTCDKIGRYNGLACPSSQDPMDKVLHEVYVCRIAKKIFEERETAAVNLLKSHISNDEAKKSEADKLLKAATTTNIGQSRQLLSTKFYGYTYQVNKPVRKFSQDKLRVQLLKRGWSTEQIDLLMSDCFDKNKPAESHKINPLGEDNE